MKNQMKKLIAMTSAAALTVTAVTAFALNSKAASDDDNLPVSKSYVELLISNLQQSLNENMESQIQSTLYDVMLEDYTDVIKEAVRSNLSNNTELASILSEQLAGTDLISFTPLEMKAGQKLSGQCEFIIRGGTVVAECPGINGLSDMTNGSNISDGVQIQTEHLIASPRDDERAVRVESDNAWVMVRGSYTIE